MIQTSFLKERQKTLTQAIYTAWTALMEGEELAIPLHGWRLRGFRLVMIFSQLMARSKKKIHVDK